MRSDDPHRTPGTLVAGAARVDLTPTAPAVYLAGFGFNRKSKGVRDPITASCLYLSDGTESVALVSGDFIGLLHNDVAEIRRQVGPELGPRALVQSTHTHAGPDTIGFWGWGIPGLIPVTSGRDERYMERVRAGIAACIQDAAADAAPARLRVARTETPNGLVRNDRVGGPLDNEMVLVHAETPTGDAIGTLVNWACHPETLWDRYREVSADFVGHLRSQFEKRVGGTVVYVSDALGGMLTPNAPTRSANAERDAFTTEFGTRVGNVAADALEHAGEPVAPADARIVRRTRSVEMELANWRYALAERLGIVRPFRTHDEGATTEVSYLRIGPAEALGVPGEALPGIGSLLKGRLRTPYRLVLGLSGDEVGYILPPGHFEDPEYAYECTMSPGPETWPTLEAALDGVLGEVEADRPRPA